MQSNSMLRTNWASGAGERISNINGSFMVTKEIQTKVEDPAVMDVSSSRRNFVKIKNEQTM